MQPDTLNSILSPVVYEDIVLSIKINTQILSEAHILLYFCTRNNIVKIILKIFYFYMVNFHLIKIRNNWMYLLFNVNM